MKASRIHRFGGPEVIRFEETERPRPGPGELLVRVGAAGVGQWDAWVRAGRSVLPQPLPLTLGADLSGTVEAVGEGVEGFSAGEDVFGVTNARFTGACAEYATVEAGRVASRPRGLDDVEAASLPVVAVTAWQMLFEQARVGPGSTVLVHGAGGNVGGHAVQLARRAGARVLATAGAADLDEVRALGAEQVIDFRSRPFEERTGPVDAVIDTIGGATQERSFTVLRPGGVLVSAVSEPDPAEAERRGVRVGFLLVDVTTSRLAGIAEAVDAGELATRVGSVLPLAEARAAHEMLEGMRPRSRGRIVLRAGGPPGARAVDA